MRKFKFLHAQLVFLNPRLEIIGPSPVSTTGLDNLKAPNKTLIIRHAKSPALAGAILTRTSMLRNIPIQWDGDGAYDLTIIVSHIFGDQSFGQKIDKCPDACGEDRWADALRAEAGVLRPGTEPGGSGRRKPAQALRRRRQHPRSERIGGPGRLRHDRLGRAVGRRRSGARSRGVGAPSGRASELAAL